MRRNEIGVRVENLREGFLSPENGKVCRLKRRK